jgi:hypothetical protein
MRVNKEDFLNAVESVQPGVATREKIEQSSAVTFRNGEILSFNDEVFCRCPSGLPETYQGAVKSSTLVNLLRRLPDESIDVEFKEQMIITGKRKESGLDLEAELSPHLDSVEQVRSDDMTRFFEATGEPIKLPKGLAESTETAEIFSSENADDNAVMVSLSPGKIEIKGQGVTGWYKERKKISYSGPALTFTIGPALLVKIVKDYNEAEVSDSFLKVTGGKWTYLSCLGRVE